MYYRNKHKKKQSHTDQCRGPTLEQGWGLAWKKKLGCWKKGKKRDSEQLAPIDRRVKPAHLVLIAGESGIRANSASREILPVEYLLPCDLQK